MEENVNAKPLFDEVVLSHSDKIYALACRLLGTTSGAEDLVQESFIRAFRFYGSFRGESSVDTWLYRITVNTWKNTVRSEKRRGFFKTFSNHPSLVDSSTKPAENVDKLEASDLIQKVLAQLEPEERAVIILRDMEGKSYWEIANILSVPDGTVKSKLYRARETLRKFILEKNYAPH